MKLTVAEKAKLTAKWATTMTKSLIAFETNARSQKPGDLWGLAWISCAKVLKDVGKKAKSFRRKHCV